jgi:6-phosphogluconate dehydrogenase
MTQIGFVGLGRMGGNMVHRIRRDSDHEVVAFDFEERAVRQAVRNGASGAATLGDLVRRLRPPRIVWIMVPAGAATQGTVDRLAKLLDRGDMIVDGGNSEWTDDKRRAGQLRRAGIEYVDVGVSGGVWGLQVGYCMMVGGPQQAVRRLAPILDVLAPETNEQSRRAIGPHGWLRFGPAGAGHYVKMVHNGVEYGLMQAYAEGFEVFDKCEYDLDNAKIAHLWGQGSVVRSWLCELAARAFEADGNDLEAIEGYTEDSGEGRWTIADATRLDAPTPVITASLYARMRSRGNGDFADRVLAALRNQFGGHAVKSAPGAASPARKTAAGKRAAAKPATAKRAASKRTAATKRATSKRAAAKPAATKRATSKRTAAKPATRKRAAKRATSQPAATKRPSSKRTAAKPAAAQRATSKRTAAKPAATKRAAPKRTAAKPAGRRRSRSGRAGGRGGR